MAEKSRVKTKCNLCGSSVDISERSCPVCGVGEEYFIPQKDDAKEPQHAAASETPILHEEERFVIIGSGIAAVAAAEEIRRILPHASVVMIAEELALPYFRPSLSKSPLTPEVGERFALHSPEWYSTRGIFLLFGRTALRILPRTKQIELSDGEILSYNKCIIATGAQSAVPLIEGHALAGVFSLRTLADFEALARHIRPEMRAVVIGGGILGLETAWQLYLSGCHVTVLEMTEQLFAQRLDEQISAQIIRIAAARDVEIRTGVTVSRLEGDGHVRQVILPGEYLNADLVLFCCGSRPQIALAQEAGLEVDRGIVVNSRMMTGKYGIYACGDCAQIGQDICGMWSTAENMGRYAGRNAAGEDSMYHPCPAPLLMNAFGSRLFAAGDCGMGGKQYRTEHRDTPHGETFLYYHESRLCGAVLLGDISKAATLLSCIESGKALSMI